MKKKTILASILGIALAGSGIKAYNLYGGLDPDVPHYLLEPSNCARYARLAAEELSGTKYVGADAWNLADVNKLKAEVKGNLEELADNGTLIPRSSIVTFYNQRAGRLRHAALYLGKNSRGELVFAHQNVIPQEDITEKELEQEGFIPKQVIAPRE